MEIECGLGGAVTFRPQASIRSFDMVLCHHRPTVKKRDAGHCQGCNVLLFHILGPFIVSKSL